MGTQLTPAMLERVQALLNDPIEGPKLTAMLNNPNTGVASNLAAVGNAVSKQTTPSGQLGAGLGTALGLGLQSLLKKKKSADPMAGRDPSGSGGQSVADAAEGPPTLEPNQMDPSDRASNLFDYTNDDTPIEVRRGGRIGKRKFRSGGEAEAEEPPAPKKRGVLVRRPILSTTIVIAKKPPEKKAKAKVEKKARGGPIKPKAIPPKSGPGNGGPSSTNGSHNGWPPTPFATGGHVQVPRGSGIAQRGKRFSGIF